MKNIILTVVFIVFTIGVNNGAATSNDIIPDEASFDGIVYIGDTMEEVKQAYPNLELTYLEGWALIDTNNAYLFNDDGILVRIAKKIDNSDWDWIKEEGIKYEDEGYFLGRTRYEVIKNNLLFTFYDNENEDIVTLEKIMS